MHGSGDSGDSDDALLIGGATLVAVGAALIALAWFGALVSAGVGAIVLGGLAVAVALLSARHRDRELAERRRRGETPDVAGTDR